MSDSDERRPEARDDALAFHQTELFATLAVSSVYLTIFLIVFFNYVA
ncbi:MAG: hypothetical protein ACYTFG_08435 [Planctomycetota bacterium]|jgi:hypothetical protein